METYATNHHKSNNFVIIQFCDAQKRYFKENAFGAGRLAVLL